MENEPFRHAVIDGMISDELCQAAAIEWPDQRWPHWHRYEGREGTKFSTKDAARLPPACWELCRVLLSLRVSELLGIGGTFPDFSLYGAGMHMIPQGGALPLHLDSDHHPVTGWGRSVSAILWIDEWMDEWGGRLRLWNADGREPQKTIIPKRGRIVVFECGDQSWHDVERVDAGAPRERRSLAVFYWTPVSATSLRPRAEFVP